MTREEAIKLLTQYIDYDAETPDYYEMEKACKVALKVLKQEPCEDCISRKEAIEVLKNNYRMKALDEIQGLPSVQPMLESYQEEKKADKKQVKLAMEGFTSFMRAICNNDNLGVPKEMADEFGISEEYRRKRIMTDYKKYINALRKCAKEHENDRTSMGHIIVSDLCRDTADLLESLEQESCEDAIDRAEALAEIEALKKIHFDRVVVLNKVSDSISALPSIQPKPKTGHWKFVQRGKYIDICCSKCGFPRVKEYAYNYTVDQIIEQEHDIKDFFLNSNMNFCENCGAKMESEVPT